MTKVISNILNSLDREYTKSVLSEIGIEYDTITPINTLSFLIMLNRRFQIMNGSTKEYYLSKLFGEDNLRKSKILFDSLGKYDNNNIL